MNRELLRMPFKITKDMYFKRDTYEIIKESDILSTVHNEVSSFIKGEEEAQYERIVEDMTKNLKNDFVSNNLKKFIENSYLIKIKQGGVPDKDAEEYTVLNKIIRKITKDRPNDFSNVISNIIDIINTKELSKYVISEEVPETVEDELVEAIEKEEEKPDRLTKYIKETVSLLYNTCFKELEEDYKKYFDEFILSQKSEIEDKVNTYMKKFKLTEEDNYRELRRNNIVNLFSYILDRYHDNVNWLDDGKYITMVTSMRLGTKYVVTSGTICPDRIEIKTSRFKELHRYNTSFTLIIGDEQL